MAQWVHVLGVAVLRVGLPSTMLVIYAVKQLWAKFGVHEFVQKPDTNHALAAFSPPVIVFLTQILPQRYVSTVFNYCRCCCLHEILDIYSSHV
jgi:hypothetical protein